MNGLKIKFNAVERIYDAYSWRLTRRAKKAWSSGIMVGNKSHGQTAEFEKSMAKYTKRKYAIAVGSGTDALYFALKAKGIGPGKKVVCPAVSYMATAEAIKRTGAYIDFVDVNKNALIDNIGIRSKPDAVVYVNLFGNLADYDYLKKYCNDNRIPLIEDAAQSLGSKYKKRMSGNLGDISACSFSPTKPLPAFGNAGMVLTDDMDEARLIQGMRYHSYNGVNLDHGYNSSIPESVSAQLNFLLGKYKSLLKKRKHVYEKYVELLSDAPVVFLDTDNNCVSNYSKLVVKVSNRDELMSYLNNMGIQTSFAYAKTLPNIKMFRQTETYNFPNADLFCAEAIALPIYPFLKDEEIKIVCEAIRKFYNV